MPDLQHTAIQKLSEVPSEDALRNYISWIDEQYCLEDIKTNELALQIITRSFIALGDLMIQLRMLKEEQLKRISITMKSAVEYVLFPNEQNKEAYFRDATNSFPFGSGDGCYSILGPGLEGSCLPGSGCRSGAGGLLFQDSYEIVYSAISVDVLPWLKGENDPVWDRV